MPDKLIFRRGFNVTSEDSVTAFLAVTIITVTIIAAVMLKGIVALYVFLFIFNTLMKSFYSSSKVTFIAFLLLQFER
jgi:hypothetical protein